MQHVSAIEKLIAKGETEEAENSLEQLLELGPNNVMALKLLASLYVQQGKFDEEDRIWRRIFEIDNEDEDAIDFYQRSQLEDREHYYFTDILPEGGRRFIAYPRSLIQISLLGLVGCIIFLMLTRLASEEDVMGSPVTVMLSFLVLVISPWVGIIYTWAKSLRTVNINQSAIEFTTRFRSFRFNWENIEKISLAHSQHPDDNQLRLVIVPRSQGDVPSVSVDFCEDSSSIRARRYLINEIRGYHNIIDYDVLEQLNLDKQKIISL